MSDDGDIVRRAIRRGISRTEAAEVAAALARLEATEDTYDEALAALARLEAASTDWLALAGRCEKAESDRNTLAEALLQVSEYPNRVIPGESDAVELAEYARAALAEAGLK